MKGTVKGTGIEWVWRWWVLEIGIYSPSNVGGLQLITELEEKSAMRENDEAFESKTDG